MKKTYFSLAILVAGLLVASDAYAQRPIKFGVKQFFPRPCQSLSFNSYRELSSAGRSDRWLGSGFIYETYVYWHNKFSQNQKITRKEYENRVMIDKMKCLEKIKGGQNNRNEDSASD